MQNQATDKGFVLTVHEVCDQVASAIVGQDLSYLLPRLSKAVGLDSGRDLTDFDHKVARWFVERLQNGKKAAKASLSAPVVTQDKITGATTR